MTGDVPLSEQRGVTGPVVGEGATKVGFRVAARVEDRVLGGEELFLIVSHGPPDVPCEVSESQGFVKVALRLEVVGTRLQSGCERLEGAWDSHVFNWGVRVFLDSPAPYPLAVADRFPDLRIFSVYIRLTFCFCSQYLRVFCGKGVSYLVNLAHLRPQMEGCAGPTGPASGGWFS